MSAGYRSPRRTWYEQVSPKKSSAMDFPPHRKDGRTTPASSKQARRRRCHRCRWDLNARHERAYSENRIPTLLSTLPFSTFFDGSSWSNLVCHVSTLDDSFRLRRTAHPKPNQVIVVQRGGFLNSVRTVLVHHTITPSILLKHVLNDDVQAFVYCRLLRAGRPSEPH